ncbi:hypothetical protein Tco_0209251 [Tanacetum coccineum]
MKQPAPSPSYEEVIMEYLVNISKRRAFTKEDTAYPCLHSPKTTKERRLIRRIQKKSICHIEDRNTAYPLLSDTAYPLPSDTAYPTFCPIQRILSTDQYVCMTRGSNSRLFTPYEEPEREFRSSRRQFKSLSLNELRSPNFNLFFDQEYSEEEEAEAMVETMEQYMSKTRTDYGSGVARPKIEKKDNFELKGQFLKEL